MRGWPFSLAQSPTTNRTFFSQKNFSTFKRIIIAEKIFVKAILQCLKKISKLFIISTIMPKSLWRGGQIPSLPRGGGRDARTENFFSRDSDCRGNSPRTHKSSRLKHFATRLISSFFTNLKMYWEADRLIGMNSVAQTEFFYCLKLSTSTQL